MKARDTIDLKNKGKKKKLGGHDDSSVAESQLSLMDIKGNIMFWLLLDLKDCGFVAVFHRL